MFVDAWTIVKEVIGCPTSVNTLLSVGLGGTKPAHKNEQSLKH